MENIRNALGLYQCDTKKSIFFVFLKFILSRISCKNFKAVSLILPEWQSDVKSSNAFFWNEIFQSCWRNLKSNYPIDLKFVLNTIEYIYFTMT